MRDTIRKNLLVEKFYEKNIGIIKVPPRRGKKPLASEMFRIILKSIVIKTDFLFVVDTEDLFKQVAMYGLNT
jgi:hypothetical protein